MLTQEYLKSILEYNEDTGVFLWKVSKSYPTKIGGAAGSDLGEYVRIKIDRKMYCAHKLAFLYKCGHMPDKSYLIDHMNGNKKDNRFINLRLVNRSQNGYNARTNKNNTSGVKGVFHHKSLNKWQAVIYVDKKRIHLGTFSTKEEAVKIIKEARTKYHGEFSNG